jgi:prolyl-tRNA synthetase
MKQSELFAKIKKEAPREAEIISHKLLTRADFIEQLASGIYSFPPLGWRVHQKIERIIREEMNILGGQEVYLPVLQPKESWEKTGRWNQMDPPLFKLRDRHQSELALGSTHEEVVTDLAKRRIQSYRDLPAALYQIQVKFRNEMRPSGGLLRTREFIMKDLYSFHATPQDLNRYFDRVIKSYFKIFKRCGLQPLKSEASGGAFTEVGARTYEFQVPAETGEDKVIFCKKCRWAVNLEVAKVKEGANCPKCSGSLKKINTIEAGHVFSLGTKYSKALNLYFIDRQGTKKPVVMGCYGIGLGRLMGAAAEIHHDEKGIVWPKEIAPFQVHLIQIEKESKIKKTADKLYQNLLKSCIEVLYDDREDKAPGEKFAEADLIGIPYRVVVSKRTLEKNSAEIKQRDKKTTTLVKITHLPQFLNSKLKN